jgi:hypothetical protein
MSQYSVPLRLEDCNVNEFVRQAINRRLYQPQILKEFLVGIEVF